MSKKVPVIMLVLLLLVVVISGCTPKEPAAIEPEKKKVLTYNLTSDPTTIDPQLNSHSNGSTINRNLFEGLVRTNAKMESVPAVAESWEVSENKKEYIFHLRKDARWSDDEPITAEDFIYSWKRVLDPSLNAKYAQHLFYLENGEAIYNGEKDISELGVEAIDAHTLKVRLEAPIPYMMELFARGVYCPVRKDIVEANPDNWAANPETCVGNGPYKLHEYSLNERVVLVPDEDYWNRDAIKLDELRFVFISDSGTAKAAFDAGDIDGFANIPSLEVPRLLLDSDEIHALPSLRTTYMTFNTTVYPVDNAKVREAMSKAIDRQMLIDNVTMSGETAASGFVPHGMKEPNGKDFRDVAGNYGVEPHAQVELAQKLLAEAGYPNGENWPKGVELMYADSDTYKRMAEAVQEMWKTNLNIDVTLTAVESKVSSSRRRGGDYTMAFAGWSGDYTNPMTFLEMFISSSGVNYPQYNSEEYNSLIAQAKAEVNEQASYDLMHQAEELAMGTDYILAPLMYRTRIIMMKDYTTGWEINLLGKYDFTYADIIE